MNPLTKVKLINELNEREAKLGIKESVSWHTQYKDSAWIFIAGFPYELTEGDIICVFSQYGEIANINLVRDKKTGKSKGFCFLCYEDQRSTILAVDNFNGIKIKGRTIRVDHVANYRPPKDSDDIDEVTKQLREEGCAPKPPSSSESEDDYLLPMKKPKKDKKEKKRKKEKKEKKKASKEERHDTQNSSALTAPVRVKTERQDSGYEKYTLKGAPQSRGEQDRLKQPDRSRDQHGNSRRGERDGDREAERRIDKSREEGRTKEDQHPGENRHRDKERGWEWERDRDKERERARDKGRDNDRERERERDRDKDRQRERESGRETDRKREQEGERERDRQKGRDRDRDRDADRGSIKHSYDREYRRN